MEKIYVLIAEDVESNGCGGTQSSSRIAGTTRSREKADAFASGTSPDYERQMQNGGEATLHRYEEHLLSD